MNLLLLATLAPLVSIGGSVILSWLLTFVIVAAVVWFIVWIVKQFAGPPVIPEGARWVIWIIVAILLLVFIFAAFGMRIP